MSEVRDVVDWFLFSQHPFSPLAIFGATTAGWWARGLADRWRARRAALAEQVGPS